MVKLILALSLFLGLCRAQEEPAPVLRGSLVDSDSAPSLNDASDNESMTDHPYLLDRQGRRHLQEGGMQPQPCNDRFSTCVNWSSFVGRSNSVSGLVIIPCGRCVTMDHAGDTLTMNDGLDIQGRLVFPNNYEGLTIRTTMVVVQGELIMSSRRAITGTPKVKFEMIGNGDRYYTPVGPNARYCGGTLCLAGKKAITVAGGRVDISGIPGGFKSFVKLYDVTDSGQSTRGIVVPADGVEGRWGVGSEVLITSYTNKGDDEQVRRITDIDTNYRRSGFIRLFLNAPISRPTTFLDDRDFAVEVALLSRHIVFEGGRDNVSFHGGHFWIFETSGQEQIVEGVEVVNFGQAGVLGRYPLHAHLCGDLRGSRFSSNVIRDSNQRCVVVHASDDMIIEDNVAYNTGGHCFMLEDGMETGNRFIGNLGARTGRPGRTIPNLGLNGQETDGEPTTFWIPALGNSWEGNIAAGSSRNGWWFEPMMRGPLASNFRDVRPEEINIVRFEGNSAHSNEIGMKTYPDAGIRPDAGSPNYLVDFNVYRNQFLGLFVFFADNLVIQGGIYADNSVGIEIDQSLSVIIVDVTIIGQTQAYTDVMAAQRIFQPCLSNRAVGLQLNIDGGRTGVTVNSADFSRFTNTRCGGEFEARIGNNRMSTNGIPGVGDGDPIDTGGGGGGGGDGGGSAHPLGDLTDPLFINCGADEIKESAGITWEPDKYFSNGVAIQTRPLRPSLYNQYREQTGNSISYTIPVNDGNYRVVLWWAEYEFSARNRREFDVFISGAGRVLQNFDVYDEAGGLRRRLKRTFFGTASNDEELTITLRGTTGDAFLTALSVSASRD